jgi:hypothetical protein
VVFRPSSLWLIIGLRVTHLLFPSVYRTSMLLPENLLLLLLQAQAPNKKDRSAPEEAQHEDSLAA